MDLLIAIKNYINQLANLPADVKIGTDDQIIPSKGKQLNGEAYDYVSMYLTEANRKSLKVRQSIILPYETLIS